jgi:hypothetical protein
VCNPIPLLSRTVMVGKYNWDTTTGVPWWVRLTSWSEDGSCKYHSFSGTPHMSFNHQGRFVQTTKPCLSTLSLKLNTQTGGHAIPPDLHRTRNANSSLKDGSCKYHSFLQVTKDIFIHRLIRSLTRRRSGHRVK